MSHLPTRCVHIATRDGICPTHVFTGPQQGPWPGVILYMDAPGIRSSIFAIASRIAAAGYLVIVPDLFYRVGGADLDEQALLFTDAARRGAWIAKYLPVASLANVRSDTRALVAWLDDSSDVAGPQYGATGYCMGGGHALTAAGAYPEKFACAASFHGGGLATDLPESPHLLAASTTARLYIACADRDPLFPDAMKQRLASALDAAGVNYVMETYAGSLHGWVPSDTPVHDPAAAERHFEALLTLLASSL